MFNPQQHFAFLSTDSSAEGFRSGNVLQPEITTFESGRSVASVRNFSKAISCFQKTYQQVPGESGNRTNRSRYHQPKSFVDKAGSLSESFAEVSMKKLVPIPPESLKRLKQDDLKDFGYQFVSVKLKDGRVFAQAVASEGCLIQVKGFREIPFVETDIESVDGDGEPWNFRRRAVRTRTPPRK